MEKIIFDKFSCTVSRGEQKRKIGSKDALVLEFLFISGNEGAAKNDILAFAWQGVVVTDASLSKSISSLRAALNELNPGVEVIITIPRIGYKIDQDKISLHNPTESQQYIIKKKISKELTESEELPPAGIETPKGKFKLPPSLQFVTKVTLSIFSVALVGFSTFRLFIAQDYTSNDFISSKIVREVLPDNRIALFLDADDKRYFKEKISKIKCNCTFMVADNEQYHFIAAYLIDEGKSIGFAFKKNERKDISSFIQEKINNGVHHE